jgi:hypothetical protein
VEVTDSLQPFDAVLHVPEGLKDGGDAGLCLASATASLACTLFHPDPSQNTIDLQSYWDGGTVDVQFARLIGEGPSWVDRTTIVEVDPKTIGTTHAIEVDIDDRLSGSEYARLVEQLSSASGTEVRSIQWPTG